MKSGKEYWQFLLRADTHLPGNDVSLPDVDVNGVQRGWQEQVLALTEKRLTLESTNFTHKQNVTSPVFLTMSI